MKHYEIESLEPKEMFEGYVGRFIHSENNTFAYWRIKANSPLPEHSHEHEQVVNILDGIYKMTVDGKEHVLNAGSVLIIPSNAKHSGFAQTDCTILDVFSPVREDLR